MPMKSKLCIITTVVLGVLLIPAYAKTVSEKGMATIKYSGSWLSDHPDSSEQRSAVKQAQANAIERYVANTNSARERIYEKKRSKLLSHVDDYILGSTLLSEERDKETKTYTVVLRADINTTRLMNDLGTGAASAADVSSTRHGVMTFLFLARKQASVRSYDDKTYKRNDTDSSKTRTTNEGESVHKHHVGTSDQVQEHTSHSTKTGGSVTRKANKVIWSVSNSDGVDTAMTGVFSNAGYSVVAAPMIEGASDGIFSVAKIRNAYSHGNDLPPHILSNATKGVREAGIKKFALGTLNVGVPDKDPVSGNIRVYVTVTGKVYGLKGRFARTLVSIGPVQYAGLGPNATVARTNALKKAGTQAAQKMVDELKNKGIN